MPLALTPALIQEGIARELIHVIQAERKELNLEYTDRIEVLYFTDGNTVLDQAIAEFSEIIKAETLAVRLIKLDEKRSDLKETSLGEHTIWYFVDKLS